MTAFYMASESSSCLASNAISKWRWVGTLLLGTLLYLAVAFFSQFAPTVLLGLPLKGLTFAMVGVIQLLFGVVAIALALRIARLNFRDVGLVTEHWCSDVFIGATVALVFALLQFLVIIPNTGGVERSDVAVHIAQLGKSVWGPLGFIVLAWTSVFFEELFFRGLVFTSLNGLWGSSRAALYVTVATTALIFAAFHGYQGWAGVVDTGLYGGLTLTLLYVWGGRLTACIVAHALWNTIATTGVYLWYC